MSELKVGDAAPDIVGLNQSGQSVSLAQMGRDVIVYFYPKDNTSGCTAEACSINSGYSALRRAGYEVVGVSPDSVKSHSSFAAKYSLGFTLVADTDHSIAQNYGVWREKSMYGRKYMGIVRTTFVIRDGRITHIIEKVDTKNHADQLLSIIG